MTWRDELLAYIRDGATASPVGYQALCWFNYMQRVTAAGRERLLPPHLRRFTQAIPRRHQRAMRHRARALKRLHVRWRARERVAS